ncbi:MAG: hypothetical protein AAFU59_05305 [Pseudomonadota bacterium]
MQDLISELTWVFKSSPVLPSPSQWVGPRAGDLEQVLADFSRQINEMAELIFIGFDSDIQVLTKAWQVNGLHDPRAWRSSLSFVPSFRSSSLAESVHLIGGTLVYSNYSDEYLSYGFDIPANQWRAMEYVDNYRDTEPERAKVPDDAQPLIECATVRMVRLVEAMYTHQSRDMVCGKRYWSVVHPFDVLAKAHDEQICPDLLTAPIKNLVFDEGLYESFSAPVE